MQGSALDQAICKSLLLLHVCCRLGLRVGRRVVGTRRGDVVGCCSLSHGLRGRDGCWRVDHGWRRGDARGYGGWGGVGRRRRRAEGRARARWAQTRRYSIVQSTVPWGGRRRSHPQIGNVRILTRRPTLNTATWGVSVKCERIWTLTMTVLKIQCFCYVTSTSVWEQKDIWF